MRKTFLIMGAILALAGACGNSDDVTDVKTRQAAEAARVDVPAASCAWDATLFEVAPMGINQLANVSDAAIVGEVTAIGEPRWNSKDGKKWCPSEVRPM